MMNNFLNSFPDRWQAPLGRLELAAMAIIVLCAFAIILSIVINFIECSRTQPRRRIGANLEKTGPNDNGLIVNVEFVGAL